MPPIYLTPAQTSGSTYPHYGAMVRDRASHAGVIIPQITQSIQDLAPVITRPTTKRGQTMQHSSPPASLSSIEASIPGSTYPAEIIKPLTLTPSVAGTVFNATPLSNVTAVARDIRSGVRGRPLIPIGLRDRAADAMPPGMRQRAAAWSRAVARFRSHRPARGNVVGRE